MFGLKILEYELRVQLSCPRVESTVESNLVAPRYPRMFLKYENLKKKIKVKTNAYSFRILRLVLFIYYYYYCDK